MNKIVDCFIFYNELDMLEFRLDYLKETVDFFVITEATKTFVGKEKPLFLKENLSRFEKYMDKIILIECDDLSDFIPESPDVESLPWENEVRHRDSINKGIDILNRLHGLNDSDIILISDLDEIPDTNTLSHIKKVGIEGINSLVQDLYYYNLSCKVDRWRFSKAIDFLTYKSYGSPHTIRMTTFQNIGEDIEKGGWHFSYFGTPEFIINKIESFSHQSLNNDEFKDIERIKARIENRENLYDDKKFEFIDPSENTYLPEGYQKLIDMAGYGGQK